MFDLSAYSWDRIKQKQHERESRESSQKKPTKYSTMTAEQKARRADVIRRWRERNKDRVREYSKRSNERAKLLRAQEKAERPEGMPTTYSLLSEEEKEIRRQRFRDWREKNPEKYEEHKRKYKEKRREQRRLKSQ